MARARFGLFILYHLLFHKWPNSWGNVLRSEESFGIPGIPLVPFMFLESLWFTFASRGLHAPPSPRGRSVDRSDGTTGGPEQAVTSTMSLVFIGGSKDYMWLILGYTGGVFRVESDVSAHNQS